MKNIPYQLQTEQAWWKDEKKNWEQLVNTAEYWLWWGMHREYPLLGEITLPSSLWENYKNCLK